MYLGSKYGKSHPADFYSGDQRRTAKPEPRDFSGVQRDFSGKTTSLYGMRSFSSLGECDPDDGNLGRFRLKKALKKVTKPVSKSVKVAKMGVALAKYAVKRPKTANYYGEAEPAAESLSESTSDQYDFYSGYLDGFSLKKIVKAVTKPIAQVIKPVAKVVEKAVDVNKIVLASVASSVGIKEPAQKLLGLTDKQMDVANKLGTVEKVVAGSLVAVAAAPAVAAAAGTVAKAVAATGGGLLKPIQKIVGIAGSLFKKTPGEAPGEYQEGSTPTPPENSSTTDQLLSKFSFLRRKNAAAVADGSGSAESSYSPGSSDTSPYSPFAPASVSAPSGGGGVPASGAADPSGAPVQAGLFESLSSNPKALAIGAAASVLFYMVSQKKQGRRSRR